MAPTGWVKVNVLIRRIKSHLPIWRPCQQLASQMDYFQKHRQQMLKAPRLECIAGVVKPCIVLRTWCQGGLSNCQPVSKSPGCQWIHFDGKQPKPLVICIDGKKLQVRNHRWPWWRETMAPCEVRASPGLRVIPQVANSQSAAIELNRSWTETAKRN